MNLSKASSFAAMLVVAFVLMGLGLTWLVLGPVGFSQRVLAFAAGCGLSFAMVAAAGHLAGQLRTPKRDPSTEIVADEVVVTQAAPPPISVVGRRAPAAERRVS